MILPPISRDLRFRIENMSVGGRLWQCSQLVGGLLAFQGACTVEQVCNAHRSNSNIFLPLCAAVSGLLGSGTLATQALIAQHPGVLKALLLA